MEGKRFFLCLALVMSGCTAKPVVVVAKRPYDFSKIRRVIVIPFDGPGGQALTHEFIRELIGTGIEVVDAHHSGDVILRGLVTDCKSNNQLTVFLGNTSIMTNGQTVTVDNPVVTASGSQATPETPSVAGRNPQVISLLATVAMNAQLMDASSKTVLWVGSGSYESLDIQDALKSVVNTMTSSLARLIPAMKKFPS